MIAELMKRSSDLHEITSKKENDIELTRKKINMLREQLQAAEKILAVNELSLSSFRAEKRNIDSKLASMQYQKKIQQAQLQKVLSTPAFTTQSVEPGSSSSLATTSDTQQKSGISVPKSFTSLVAVNAAKSSTPLSASNKTVSAPAQILEVNRQLEKTNVSTSSQVESLKSSASITRQLLSTTGLESVAGKASQQSVISSASSSSSNTGLK